MPNNYVIVTTDSKISITKNGVTSNARNKGLATGPNLSNGPNADPVTFGWNDKTYTLYPLAGDTLEVDSVVIAQTPQDFYDAIELALTFNSGDCDCEALQAEINALQVALANLNTPSLIPTGITRTIQSNTQMIVSKPLTIEPLGYILQEMQSVLVLF